MPQRADGVMRVHFLDVGQGDCALIEFASGNVLVVDAGNGTFATRTKILRYLKGIETERISFLATHADKDHYGGFSALLRTIELETFYLPLVDAADDDYIKLKNTVFAGEMKVDVLTRYDVITDSSGAYVVCVSPISSETDGDTNDTSTVLWLSYCGVNILFAGDVSKEKEATLTKEYALADGIFDYGEYRVRLEETNILKVSHHGSNNSCSEDWLQLLSAEAAIVSCGKGNSYGHPSIEAMERLQEFGAEIYRTDELGDVVVSIGNGTYLIN